MLFRSLRSPPTRREPEPGGGERGLTGPMCVRRGRCARVRVRACARVFPGAQGTRRRRAQSERERGLRGVGKLTIVAARVEADGDRAQGLGRAGRGARGLPALQWLPGDLSHKERFFTKNLSQTMILSQRIDFINQQRKDLPALR